MALRAVRDQRSAMNFSLSERTVVGQGTVPMQLGEAFQLADDTGGDIATRRQVVVIVGYLFVRHDSRLLFD